MPSKRLSNVTQIYVLSSDIHDPSPRPLEPEVTTMKMRRLWSGRNKSLHQRAIACAKERVRQRCYASQWRWLHMTIPTSIRVGLPITTANQGDALMSQMGHTSILGREWWMADRPRGIFSLAKKKMITKDGFFWMSDQQQNAELATDLDNDLTLFLVHRLLICSSIDAVENRKQDSKKKQSRTENSPSVIGRKRKRR